MRTNVRVLLFGTIGAVAACSTDSLTGVQACQTNCSATLSANVTANRTLHEDTVYTVSGYVKIASGVTLTIEPGTKIIGDTTVAGSSLWVLPGGKINAQGTATKPIVFTSARAAGFRKPGDWGGIIMIGKGKINRTGTPIFTEGPAGTVAENYAGGTDNADNSGTLQYVRIEFAGYDVSGGAGQELNSLSMYAVGRGTTIEYVQSMAGLDDSFEFFGGAVDVRHLVSYESGDDHFDWTEGYSGRGQYLIALQTTVVQPLNSTVGAVSTDPRGFEGDGCEVTKSGCAYTNTPFSMPVWANFTVIGPGPGVFATASRGDGVMMRRGTGGTFVNGVIGRWPEYGMQLRNTESENLRLVDSVIVRNVTLVENTTNFEALNVVGADPTYGVNLNQPAANFTLASGTAAALFTSLTPASLDWTPAVGASIRTSGLTTFPAIIAARVTNYFGATMTATAYQGAADPAAASKWWQGWTVYYTN